MTIVQEIIKELLEENDMSQEKFAQSIGVSQKAVSNWINGVDTPKASSMLCIYETYEITPNELLGVEPRRTLSLENRKTK